MVIVPITWRAATRESQNLQGGSSVILRRDGLQGLGGFAWGFGGFLYVWRGVARDLRLGLRPFWIPGMWSAGLLEFRV